MKSLFNENSFHLKDIGLVTCEHAISSNLLIYSATELGKKYPVSTIRKNGVIDIALIKAHGLPLSKGLPKGSSDYLKQMDHVAIAGFPNYRKGDTGILSPGLVIGFRISRNKAYPCKYTYNSWK